MTKTGKWILVLLALAAVYLGSKWFADTDEEAESQRGADPSLLFDRVWIDSIPEARTDYMQIFVALSDTPIGVFQKSSDYRVEAEIYTYNRKENRVKVFFPQSKTKKGFSYKVRECDDLPPFDLCLELSKNPWGGPKRYYSLRDQDDLSAEELLGADLADRALSGL